MTRKLFSMPLCALALLLLMGASPVPEDETPVLAQEESAAANGSETLETESENKLQFEVNDECAGQIGWANPEFMEQCDPFVPMDVVMAPAQVDEVIFIDGQSAPIEIGRVLKDDTTYVSLVGMAKALDESVSVAWDGGSGTATVTTANLTLTATVGQQYVVANGRYLYLEEPVAVQNGTTMVPLSVVVKAFDAKLTWDAATGTIHVQRGSGALVNGNAYYNQDDLFWLSRVIYAEAGNQSLEGKMAVGNVVLNRVNNPIFPNTIHGVLSQRNQFTTYKGGALANRTPTESCIIAAKLVMDGGVVEEVAEALWFDAKCANSWAARNKTHLVVIGGHKFYG